MVKQLVISFFIASNLSLTPSTLPAKTAAQSAVWRTPDGHAAILESSSIRLRVAFDLTDIQAPTAAPVVSGLNLTPVESGVGTTLDPGQPMLPRVSRFVVVPPDRGLELAVTSDPPTQVPIEGEPPVFQPDSEEAAEFGAVMAVGKVDSRQPYYALPGNLYPAQFAEMSEPFVIRGVRLVRVTTYPLQYDPAQRCYLRRDHIQADIHFTDAAPVNPVEHPIRKHRSHEFLKFINAIALNGDIVGRDDPDRDQDPPFVGHYLVVTPDSCLPFVRPFIEWRRKAGYKVDIFAVQADMVQDPNSIKQHIQELYDAYLNRGEDPFDEILLIGDRSTYQHGPSPHWLLEAPAGYADYHGPNAQHGDFLYACLEGGNDDIHPDVGIARWQSGSEATINLASGRTLAYEATPFMDNTDWFGRCGVYSQHWGASETSAWHITIHTTVRWAEEVMKVRGFNDVQFFEQMQWDQAGNDIGHWMRDLFNEGANLLLGRAQVLWLQDHMDAINDNQVFPICIETNGVGNSAGETMFRSGDGDHLKGVVAETFNYGTMATLPNNYLWLEMVSGVMQHDLSLGWSRLLAINGIENYIPNINYDNGAIYGPIKTDFEVCGDPGIKPWIGVPRLVEAQLSAVPTPESNVFEVTVTDTEGHTVPDAQVTLYAPGNLPDEIDHYAVYNDMQALTVASDADGLARLTFGNGQFVEGTPIYVTVTGRDIRPFFIVDTVRTPDISVAVASYRLQQSQGNGDDNVNPTEIFALSLTAANTGQQAVENVSCTIETSSPFARVIDNDQISFGNIAVDGEAAGNRAVTFVVGPACPDGAARPITTPEFNIDFTDGGHHWQSAIKLDVVAPHYGLQAIVGGNVVPDSIVPLDLDLINKGRLAAGASTTRLVSLGMGVSVIQDRANYPAIAAGQHSQVNGDPFLVAGVAMVPPGTICPMVLMLTTQDQFVDSVFFDLQVGEPHESAPLTSDKYGYICFDNTDTSWERAPQYDWVEIDPRVEGANFQGERLTALEGASEFDIGKCAAIPTGIAFQFYGHTYDTLTVVTNGFIAVGNQPRIVNFQNWPLDRCIGGGAGMIAPFWDDLRLVRTEQDTSAIFSYYDRDSGRLIVEWKGLRNAANPDTILTFEAVIYDWHDWFTPTNDCDIRFQYKQVSMTPNIRNGDTEWVTNSAYASVGISSPEGTSGVSYTWNNEYPVACAPIENRRAILFTISPRQINGATIYGHVTDAANHHALRGVRIWTQHGLLSMTDSTGFYRLATNRFESTLTFHLEGYNDSTVVVRDSLGDNDSLELDLSLLHPEFAPSQQNFNARLNLGGRAVFPFTIQNNGNGPLIWRAETALRGEANVAPWELRHSYAVADSTHDDRIEGAVFANDRFYLCGANGDDSNAVYVLDRDGTLLNAFQQCGHSHYGFKDLEWDGQLIWASGEQTIYGFTTAGEVVRSWQGPYNPTNNIAWDPQDSVLWLAGTTTNISAYDREGNQNGIVLNRKGMRIYGLAFWPDDPDGYKLYILSEPGGNEQSRIYKMNTQTNDTMFVTTLADPAGGTGRNSAFITNQFDVDAWVMMTTDNVAPASSGDQLQIYQLEARKDWMILSLGSGRIEAGNQAQLTLTLDATQISSAVHLGELHFYHNATGLESSLPITLTVNPVEAPLDREAGLPKTLAITEAYPNPFNETVQIGYALHESGDVRMSVFDLQGREVALLVNGRQTAGEHRTMWQGKGSPTGMYILRLASSGQVRTTKLVMVK